MATSPSIVARQAGERHADGLSLRYHTTNKRGMPPDIPLLCPTILALSVRIPMNSAGCSKGNRPEFPKRFGCIEDARSFCRGFFAWYNTRHRHSAIGWLTPETVHYGRGKAAIVARQAVLDEAYQRHPERFLGGPPVAPTLPSAVWINPPDQEVSTQEKLTYFEKELSQCP